jgi:hypothetical protein
MSSSADADRAFEIAKRQLLNRLTSPEDLHKIPELLAEHRKKLDRVEGQISAVLQTQLDEMQHAMNLIDTAREEMTGIKSNFAVLHGQCTECKGLLGDHPKIKAVNVARKNITNTLQQVNFYRQIPAQVERLSNELAEDPSKLQMVYSEYRQLKGWRDAVLGAVRKSLERARQHEQEGEHSQRRKSIACGSVENQNQMLQVLGDHLESVAKLQVLVRTVIKDTVRDCLRLAQYNPSRLVQALKIVEVTDGEQKVAYDTALAAIDAAESNEDLEGLPVPIPPEDLRGGCTAELQTMMNERIQNLFSEDNEHQEEEGGTAATAGTAGAAEEAKLGNSPLDGDSRASRRGQSGQGRGGKSVAETLAPILAAGGGLLDDLLVSHTVLLLYSYCTHTVLLLYSYCTHTVLILYSYCTPTVLTLYSYCTYTVLLLYSYCAHTGGEL